MQRVRIFPGGVTASSAALRVEGWPGPEIPLRLEPEAPGVSLRVEPAPLMIGESSRWRVLLDGLAPDTIYRLRLGGPEGGTTAWIRTAPERLLGSSGLLLGLGSCYFPSDEYWTNARAILRCLDARARRSYELGASPAPDPRRGLPTATFLVGDQIYADVPRSSGRTLVGLYRGRYGDAWQSSRLGAVLASGGNFFTGDDHEFWNGYPERMLWLSRSWDGEWRRTARIAADGFWCHQGVWNFPPGFDGGLGRAESWARGRLGEVDLFVADARTDRTGRDGRRCPRLSASGNGECPPGSRPGFLSVGQRDALVSWIRTVRRIGLLVLPQPMAQTGGRFDSALSDYPADFEPVREALRETIVGRGVSLVVLSGDIHWGRLTSWRPDARSPGRLVEFVASPIARVGLLSILHTRFDVGATRDPRGRPKPEELAVLSPEFPERQATRHFATGENCFGLLELTGDPAGRLKARLELWSLQTKRAARDRWGRGGGTCVAELLV